MTEQKASSGTMAMEWLVRYARHCQIQPQCDQPLGVILRSRFRPAEWRIVCRSGRAPFVPLLRNRELGFDDLVLYCSRLAEHGFAEAPRAELLAFFSSQRRRYFNERCKIPSGVDFQLMRIAGKEHSVSWSQLALVANWVAEFAPTLGKKTKWKSLVARAFQARQHQMLSCPEAARTPWHFFCDEVHWRGDLIRPLRDAAALWSEGVAMGNCLYSLRRLCSAPQPSRFFSVTRAGRRIATLELYWSPPEAGFQGMRREVGRWQVRDVRLSFNRVPDERLCQSMVEFAGMYDTWARRPGRWPGGHLDAVRHRVELAFRRGMPPGMGSSAQSVTRRATVASSCRIGVPWSGGLYDLAQLVVVDEGPQAQAHAARMTQQPSSLCSQGVGS